MIECKSLCKKNYYNDCLKLCHNYVMALQVCLNGTQITQFVDNKTNNLRVHSSHSALSTDKHRSSTCKMGTWHMVKNGMRSWLFTPYIDNTVWVEDMSDSMLALSWYGRQFSWTSKVSENCHPNQLEAYGHSYSNLSCDSAPIWIH